MTTKKDLIKKYFIDKNWDNYEKDINLTNLDDIILNYSNNNKIVYLDSLFSLAKITNNISADFYLDRNFINKNDFLNFAKSDQQLKKLDDEYSISYDKFLSLLKDFLFGFGLKDYDVFEIQFLDKSIKWKKYITLFLVYINGFFYKIDFKIPDEKLAVLDNIKEIVDKYILQPEGIIVDEKNKLFIKEFNQTSDFFNILVSQIPNVVKDEIDSYNYQDIYDNINLDFFFNYDFIWHWYINYESLYVIKEWILNNQHIIIYADYDSDWFNSAIQIYKLFRFIWYNNFRIIFPTRESEYISIFWREHIYSKYTGYWIQENIVDELKDGDILITLDNGGAQINVFKEILRRWLKVKAVIIDHHNLRYTDEEWLDYDDEYYMLQDFFKREWWIKLDELADKQIVRIKDSFEIYYNHPYFEWDINEISATIMTFLWIIEFLKISSDITGPYNDFIKNISLHAAIWQITDVMSLLPTTKNIGLLVYIFAKKNFNEMLNELERLWQELWVSLSWEQILKFDESWSRLSDYYQRKIKEVLKETIYTPYSIVQKQLWDAVEYTLLNKEILFLMRVKKIAKFNVSNIWFVIWPIINGLGRLSSVEELLNFFIYLTEDQSTLSQKYPEIEKFKNITEIINIRKKTVDEWKRLLERFLWLYWTLNQKEMLYLPEEYIQFLFLISKEKFNFKEYLELDSKFIELSNKWIIQTKKDLYKIWLDYWISDEYIRLYNKNIFSFISPFNGLIASKISDTYDISTIVLSAIKDPYLRFHGSWRWIGNINLNTLLQDLKWILLQYWININGWGHSDAVGLEMEYDTWKRVFYYEDILDLYYFIQSIIKQYLDWYLFPNWNINEEAIYDFYKPIVYKKLILKYSWQDIIWLLDELMFLADKWTIFGNWFSWKPVYIPIDIFFNTLWNSNKIKDFDNINFQIWWKYLYADIYMRKIYKNLIKDKDLNWLLEEFSYVKIDVMEWNKGLEWLKYSLE